MSVSARGISGLRRKESQSSDFLFGTGTLQSMCHITVLREVSLSYQIQTELLPEQTYHFFVVLLIDADHRLLYYNVSDFREVRKIVPLFPDFVFLLILLVFIFQLFPFQFVFFLFNRNNLIRCIRMPELSWLSHFLLVKNVKASGKLRQGLHSRRSQPACLNLHRNWGRGHM